MYMMDKETGKISERQLSHNGIAGEEFYNTLRRALTLLNMRTGDSIRFHHRVHVSYHTWLHDHRLARTAALPTDSRPWDDAITPAPLALPVAPRLIYHPGVGALTALATIVVLWLFFFSSRRRHTRCSRDWSSDVCSSDLAPKLIAEGNRLDGFTIFSLDYQLKRPDSLLRSSIDERAAKGWVGYLAPDGQLDRIRDRKSVV